MCAYIFDLIRLTYQISEVFMPFKEDELLLQFDLKYFFKRNKYYLVKQHTWLLFVTFFLNLPNN